MIRFPQAVAGVMLCTLLSGVVGGGIGAGVGYLAPSFVGWLHSPFIKQLPPNFNPVEFALGLGIVSGLFLGAGTGVFLTVILAFRDGWVARGGRGGTGSAKERDEELG